MAKKVTAERTKEQPREEPRMAVLIIKTCGVEGRTLHPTGAPVLLLAANAQLLLRRGLAIKADEAAKAAPPEEPEETEESAEKDE